MKPSRELLEEQRRGKIEQSRSMRPIDRLFRGPELFDYACEISRMGIRMQNPDATPEVVEKLLVRRLSRRLT